MHPTPTQIQTTALITELVANRREVNNTLEELAEVSTPLLKEVLGFAVANDLPLTLAGWARAKPTTIWLAAALTWPAGHALNIETLDGRAFLKFESAGGTDILVEPDLSREPCLIRPAQMWTGGAAAFPQPEMWLVVDDPSGQMIGAMCLREANYEAEWFLKKVQAEFGLDAWGLKTLAQAHILPDQDEGCVYKGVAFLELEA